MQKEKKKVKKIMASYTTEKYSFDSHRRLRLFRARGVPG